MAPPAAPAPVPRKRVNKCSPAFINDMWELHTGLYMMDAWEKTLFVRAGGTPGARARAWFALLLRRRAARPLQALAPTPSARAPSLTPSTPPTHAPPRAAEQLPRGVPRDLRVLRAGVVLAGCMSGAAPHLALPPGWTPPTPL